MNTTDNSVPMLKVGDVAKKLHVSAQTVRDWTEEGKLSAKLSEGGHRTYSLADVNRLVYESEEVPGYRLISALLVMDLESKIQLANEDGVLSVPQFEFVSFSRYWDFNNGLERMPHQVAAKGSSIREPSESTTQLFYLEGEKDYWVSTKLEVASVDKKEAEELFLEALPKAKEWLKENYVPVVTIRWKSTKGLSDPAE